MTAEQQAAVEVPTFQDSQVRFSVHRKPSCMIEFEVEVFEPLAKTAYQHAVKKVSKGVSLPGFRKGKAPEVLIEKNYANEVDKEYQQALSDCAFRACVQLAKILPLNQETRVTYKMKSHSRHGALLSLTFEVEPLIPAIDPALCQIKPVKRPEVSDAKVDETIRQVQFFFAKWEKVEGRSVQEGDFVLLDVDVIEETLPAPLFRSTRFEVTKKSMADWMYQLVIGKNVGDVLEGVSTPDTDASTDDKEALLPKKVSVTIQALDTATLPTVDDAFVKQLGVETVSDFRSKIKTLLDSQATAHVLDAEREQVTNFLLNDCPFDLPASLVQKETQTRLEGLAQDPEFLDHWKSLSPEKRQETLATVHTQSDKAVRLFYLCRKLLTDAGIRISAEDLATPPLSPLEVLLDSQKLSHRHSNPKIEHAEAFARLVLEKAEDLILSKATRKSES